MKRLLLIPTLLLQLWGCSKNDLINNVAFGDINQSTPITLSVNNESLTRGSIVDSEVTMGSVGMYCAYTANEDWSSTSTVFNKMENARFNYNGKTLMWDYDENNSVEQPIWGYTSLADKYTFFAYSPYLTDNNNILPSIASGVLQIDYTVPTTCADQVDLLLATSRKNISPQVGGKVNMQFNHTLAKVEFSVKGDGKRKIKSITLKGLETTGVLTSIDAAPYFSWAKESSTGDFTVTAGVDLKNQAPNKDGTTVTPLTTNNGYLFMLPQDASNKTVTVVTTDTAGKNEESADITFPANTKWVAGEQYNYIINAKEATIPYFHEIYPDVATCYIVNKTLGEITIPINEYISYFWKEYGANEAEKAWANLTTDQLEANVIWSEQGVGASNISIAPVTLGSGTTTMTNVTNGTKDFTAVTSTMVMKFTVDNTYENNNFTVGVKRSGSTEYLWSWHIWVTDYDPYIAANQIEDYCDVTWMDRNLGAYVNTFVSKGNGNLFYQWGRKDPLPTAKTDAASTASNIATSVKVPNKFYKESRSWLFSDWIDLKNRSAADKDYHWRDNKLLQFDNDDDDYDVPGTMKYDKRKSIFDPSPLGWRVPGSSYELNYRTEYGSMSCGTWDPYKIGACVHMDGLFFPAAGMRRDSDGLLVNNSFGAYYWNATPYNELSAYSFSLDKYDDSANLSNYQLSRANAFPMRCVKEVLSND